MSDKTQTGDGCPISPAKLLLVCLRGAVRRRALPKLADFTETRGEAFETAYSALEETGYYSSAPTTPRRRRKCIDAALAAISGEKQPKARGGEVVTRTTYIQASALLHRLRRIVAKDADAALVSAWKRERCVAFAAAHDALMQTRFYNLTRSRPAMVRAVGHALQLLARAALKARATL